MSIFAQGDFISHFSSYVNTSRYVTLLIGIHKVRYNQ